MKYMPVDMNIRFCQYLLAGARAAAKRAKVAVPKGLTALRSDRKQFWVEAKGVSGEYVQADNAYEAKAKFIYSLVDKAEAHGKTSPGIIRSDKSFAGLS
jgi:hypothetical protein